jgi:hypothetical protein
LPVISNAVINESNGTVELTLTNAAPGQFPGTLEVRMIYPDGSSVAVPSTIDATTGVFTVTPPAKVAIASVGWQVVRKIPAAIVGSAGILTGDETVDFPGNVVHFHRPLP